MAIVRPWYAVSRIWKIDNRIITIAYENRALTQLRSTLINGIYLETIHVIGATSDGLQVIRKQSHDGTGLLIGIKQLLLAQCYRTMAQRGRE